jgi:hypothetical protein
VGAGSPATLVLADKMNICSSIPKQVVMMDLKSLSRSASITILYGINITILSGHQAATEKGDMTRIKIDSLIGNDVNGI